MVEAEEIISYTAQRIAWSVSISALAQISTRTLQHIAPRGPHLLHRFNHWHFLKVRFLPGYSSLNHLAPPSKIDGYQRLIFAATFHHNKTAAAAVLDTYAAPNVQQAESTKFSPYLTRAEPVALMAKKVHPAKWTHPVLCRSTYRILLQSTKAGC